MEKKSVYGLRILLFLFILVMIRIIFMEVDLNREIEEGGIKFDLDSAYRVYEETINSSEIDSFSPYNLQIALFKYNVKHPDIVFKQSILETGYFTSNISRENNNLVGMKLPRIRSTTAIGRNRGHAVYEDWISCVKDMVLFQRYYKNRINRSKDYYDFLDQIYATDKNYIKKVKNIKYESNRETKKAKNI